MYSQNSAHTIIALHLSVKRMRLTSPSLICLML